MKSVYLLLLALPRASLFVLPRADCTHRHVPRSALRDPTGEKYLQVENGSWDVNATTLPPSLDERMFSYVSELWHMTRPHNIPVVSLMHMLGIYFVVEQAGLRGMYWSVLLAQPSSWVAWGALVLGVSSSMVINDYFDAKLGRDPDGLVTSGRVPVAVVKRFCTILYALGAINLALIPVLSSRLLVLAFFFATYSYTHYLKPVTWIKTLVCALIIGGTPVISAWTASGQLGLNYALPSLWRFVGAFSLCVVGREVIMDCDDVVDDRKSGIRTIPVVYGRRFATRVALAATVSSGILFVMDPLRQHLTNGVTYEVLRKLVLACVGSAVGIRGAWKVLRTEGRDSSLISSALDEGLIVIAPLMLSFV